MPSTTTAEEKAALRAALRRQAADLTPEERRDSDAALFARFLDLPQVAQAETILLYHGMGTEPDTKQLLAPLWAAGKRLALPRCTGPRAMEARVVTPSTPLHRHRYGMREPGAECPLVEPEELDLVLVPGLAFDKQGRRLGQGGGFYDCYLPRCTALTVALCRSCFLLEHIPREEHDCRVAGILTEQSTLFP